MTRVALCSLVNDDEQFARCQASLRRVAQPFPEWLKVEPNRNGWNAARGLNHGLGELDADWVVCVHQDVLFPEGFWARLTGALAALPTEVALAGIVGCEASGAYRGHVFDPNGHCYWPSLPADVAALDEVLIAVRRASGLRFDERVPGFHCYGADICYQARQRGLRVVAIDAPLVHLSTGSLDEHYQQASRWLMERWGAEFGYVLATPAQLLRDDPRAGFLHRLLHRWRRRGARRSRNRNPCREQPCPARTLGEVECAS
ncbi:MAG TPA: glycosyltransferase [bacterium]|nr:glycosyltransferase [bacterium]